MGALDVGSKRARIGDPEIVRGDVSLCLGRATRAVARSRGARAIRAGDLPDPGAGAPAGGAAGSRPVPGRSASFMRARRGAPRGGGAAPGRRSLRELALV